MIAATDSHPFWSTNLGRWARADQLRPDDLLQTSRGNVYGDSTCGQKALYRAGMTGMPVVNVNNNCSTGSSALFPARQAVESGAADCVLAFGFEQMERGALKLMWDDRATAFDRFDAVIDEVSDDDDVPMAPHYFGAAATAYAERYGMSPEVYARISVKARKHAANNPYAVFQEPVTLRDVLGSPRICGPLTRLQCCPPTCGGAAAVVTSEEFALAHGLRTDVVIAAQAMAMLVVVCG